MSGRGGENAFSETPAKNMFSGCLTYLGFMLISVSWESRHGREGAVRKWRGGLRESQFYFVGLGLWR
jgi:hypothetical protein